MSPVTPALQKVCGGGGGLRGTFFSICPRYRNVKDLRGPVRVPLTQVPLKMLKMQWEVQYTIRDIISIRGTFKVQRSKYAYAMARLSFIYIDYAYVLYRYI